MKYNLLEFKKIIVGAALVAVITAGALSSHSVAVHADSYLNRSLMPVHIFPKNQNGQTYGSEIDATSPETAPELISALGVDGTNGYVKRTELEGEVPKTPEEAVALTKKNMASGGRQIPLYSADGKTVIGVFNIGKAQVKEIQE